jgi:hypothetical protein
MWAGGSGGAPYLLSGEVLDVKLHLNLAESIPFGGSTPFFLVVGRRVVVSTSV